MAPLQFIGRQRDRGAEEERERQIEKLKKWGERTKQSEIEIDRKWGEKEIE